jgi:WD40 repeat protein
MSVMRLPILVAGLSLICGPLAAEDAPAEKITYADHVLPLLRQRCGSCHNANDKKGGLVVDNYGGIMTGGSSGAVLEGGDLSASYLWNLVNHDSQPNMPPNADKLPQPELDIIKKWIEGGLLEKSDSVAKIKMTKSLAKIEVSGARPANVAMPQKYFGEPRTVSTMANAVTALAVSPWASLAAVSGHHQISLWNTATFELLGTLDYPEGQPHILKFSRNGSLLLAGGGHGGATGKVVVFDVATGERQVEVGDEYDLVLGADISPDQTQIALGGPKKILRIYSTATGEQLFEMKKHTDWITAVEYSPDGVLVASGDRSNGLFVWESFTGREFYSLTGHQGAITDVSWRPDSNVLASSSEDNTIRLWEMTNGTQVKSWNAHGGAASVEYVRDGRLVSTGRDRVVRLWNGDGGQIREFGGMTDLGLEVAFDAETERVLGGDWSGVVRVWNAADGAELGQLSTNPQPATQRIAKLMESLAPLDAQSQQLAANVAQMTKAMTDAQELAVKSAADAAAAMAKVPEATAAKTAAEKVVAEKAVALQAAEQALQAARAAYEKAIVEKDASSKVNTDAVALVAATTAAEKAAAETAAQLKEAADKAAAAAQPTPEQQKALADAQAAAKAAADKAASIKAQLERLQQVVQAAAQTAANTPVEAK